MVAWDNAQGDPNAEADGRAFSVNPQMNQGVAVAFQSKASASQSMNPSEIAPTLDKSKADGVVIGFDRTKGTVSGDVAAPLRCNSAQRPEVRAGKADNQCVAHPVTTRPGQRLSSEDNYVLAYRQRHYERPKCGGKLQASIAHPLLATESHAGDMTQRLLTSYGVRRLTPVECERLQGFPDNWTEGQSDTKRYKQLGNAVCVPVAEWIGRRILAASRDELEA